MRMDKLTSRFQQALADAQSLAVGRDNNMLEPVHLMAALLDQQAGSTVPLLSQAGAQAASAGPARQHPERPCAQARGRVGRRLGADRLG